MSNEKTNSTDNTGSHEKTVQYLGNRLGYPGNLPKIVYGKIRMERNHYNQESLAKIWCPALFSIFISLFSD